jgi:hypothetical protein
MVECLECHTQKKSLMAHVRVHGMTVEQYRAKHTDTEGNFPDMGWSVQTVVTARRDGTGYEKQEKVVEVQPEDVRFRVLFLQADEDPALEPTIRQIVRTEQHIQIYQNSLDKLISEKVPDFKQIAAVTKAAKEAQETNLKLLESLNLTRAKKQANRKTVETTPSILVAGILKIIKDYPEDKLKRVNDEMIEAAEWLRRNVDSLKTETPTKSTDRGGSDDEPAELLVAKADSTDDW